MEVLHILGSKMSNIFISQIFLLSISGATLPIKYSNLLGLCCVSGCSCLQMDRNKEKCEVPSFMDLFHMVLTLQGASFLSPTVNCLSLHAHYSMCTGHSCLSSQVQRIWPNLGSCVSQLEFRSTWEILPSIFWWWDHEQAR